VPPELPTGTVTFLFTDVEGSTRLLHELGTEMYAKELVAHRRVVRQACSAHGGVELGTEGDAMFFAFSTAPGALASASELTAKLASGRVQVRVGVHTGTPLRTEEEYVGEDVHLTARIAASGHGSQVLVSAATAALAPSGSEPQALPLLDLGEHRLKDIAEPVAIFQLGEGSFPPLKTISNTNLPRPASSFVGRERELREVLARIEAGSRLVSLTGPGGSGKTRLALEAAATLVPEFKAGVFWVGLAALRDPALVTESISHTLGATNGPAQHIGERELLLLLDNLEQVVEAAPELSALVSSCPNLTLLVTSRELLRVQGEVEYAVPPLAAPEAIELFCVRAQMEPSDEIGELCRRLDSLPLAVELAAARTRSLAPGQILERLSQRLDLLEGGRDADPRQQTLRATIEWSHDLLSEDEQRLFRRLSVFAGGSTLPAAEEVVEADVATLQSLVEKSLLRFADGRYWMLDTIREYASERLEASVEAESIRRRHADHVLALVTEAEPHLQQGSTDWAARLGRDQDNIRAAYDFLEGAGDNDLALRLVASAWWLWTVAGQIHEGRRLLERALAGDERPTAARAHALMGAAEFAGGMGDEATARLRGEEALALLRTLSDDWAVAFTLFGLGFALSQHDDFEAAHERFAESVRIFDELGDEHWALQASRRLAFSYVELGDHERARAVQEDVLHRARASGDTFIESKALAALGQYALDAGRTDEAVPFLVEAHRVQSVHRWSLADRYWSAVLVCRFARALALRDRPGPAAELVSCFEGLLAETEVLLESHVARMNDVTLTMIREQLDEEAIAQAWQRGAGLTYDQAVDLALAHLD
jgi:predicted ATPase/class 3 adenylate cyclase